MNQTVHLPGFLARYAGGDRMAPASGATVGAALRDVAGRHAELGSRLLDRHGILFAHLVAFRNGQSLPREGLMEMPLADGDVLEIHAAASGG